MNVIVTGHGTFATGIEGALALLVKIPSNWTFVNFSEGLSDEQLQEKFKDIIKSSSGDTLIFTDLVGGTPYKVAAMLAAKNPHLAVVSGCNLGSLLEAIFKKYTNVVDFAQDLVDLSKKGTQIFDQANFNLTDLTSPADSDGI